MSLITLSEHGMVSVGHRAVDASYISDAMMLLRHFEARGAVHTAVSVIKKRYGPHEKTIRELTRGC